MGALFPRTTMLRPFGVLLLAALSVSFGAVLATTDASLVSVGLLVIGIATACAFMLSPEAVLTLLLVTSPIGLEQLTNDKRSFLPSLGGFDAASLRLVIFMLAGGVLLVLRGLPRRLTWQEKTYAVLILWLSTSLAFTPSLFGGTRYVGKVAVLFLAWLAFSHVILKYSQKAVLRILLLMLAAVLVGDYGLLAAGRGSVTAAGVTRFGGLADAPAAGALSVAVLGLVALYVWFADHKGYALVLYSLAWGPVLFSVTRIAIAGFLVTSVLLAVLMGRQRQAFTIVVLIGAISVSYAPLRERMAFGSASGSWQSVLTAFDKRGVEGINTEGRLTLWVPLIEQFKRSPVIGGGAGDSEFVVRSVTDEYVQQAHSDYLALLVNGGLVAGVLWLLALGGLAMRFMKRRQISALATAAIVLYLITAITDNAVEMYAELGLPLAMILALAFSAGTDGPRRRKSRVTAPRALATPTQSAVRFEI